MGQFLADVLYPAAHSSPIWAAQRTLPPPERSQRHTQTQTLQQRTPHFTRFGVLAELPRNRPQVQKAHDWTGAVQVAHVAAPRIINHQFGACIFGGHVQKSFPKSHRKSYPVNVVTNDPSRVARDKSARGHILGHHGTGSDNRAVTALAPIQTGYRS